MVVNGISLRVIAYVLGPLALAICGFIAYNILLIRPITTNIVNVLAMTIALYLASSIVVGGEPKKLLNVFVISLLAIVISDLCFSFLQHFIALCVSLSVLLVIIRYSLVKDHDSGWSGALCAELMGLIFLLIIELILAMAKLFLF